MHTHVQRCAAVSWLSVLCPAPTARDFVLRVTALASLQRKSLNALPPGCSFQVTICACSDGTVVGAGKGMGLEPLLSAVANWSSFMRAPRARVTLEM